MKVPMKVSPRNTALIAAAALSLLAAGCNKPADKPAADKPRQPPQPTPSPWMAR